MTSAKYIGIISTIILITLSSGCISLGGFADILSSDDNSSNFTEVNKTADGTYSVEGVSFKCPDNWNVNFDGYNSITASQINEPKTNTIGPFETATVVSSGTNPQFTLYILNNNGMSNQEALNQARSGFSSVGTTISSDTIKIDGNKAYKEVLYNELSEESVLYECIYFVKKGKTYLMYFSAREKDFENERQNFNIILNSFKVQ